LDHNIWIYGYIVDCEMKYRSLQQHLVSIFSTLPTMQLYRQPFYFGNNKCEKKLNQSFS
jgi:hypothetical protein